MFIQNEVNLLFCLKKTMTRQIFFHIFLIFLFQKGSSQVESGVKLDYGIEIDALPYITGGWFGAAWMGKNNWRLRILATEVYKPDWSINRNYKNHHIHSYALLFDGFLKKEWKGWWIGSGLVFWKSDIMAANGISRSNFENFLLNGSIGYHWKLGRKIYLSPWRV